MRFADEWFTFFPAGTLEPVRADLSLSYAEAGWLLVALSAGGLIGNGFSVAADYVDRRLLASLGALVFGLSLGAYSLGGSFGVLLVASFVWGAASDAFIHGSEVALVDLHTRAPRGTHRDDLGTILGRVNALGAVGDLLGPLTFVAASAAGLGWRVVYAGSGVLMLVYAAWLGGQRFPGPRPPDHSRTPLRAVLAVARDRRVLLLGLVDGLFGLLDEPFLGFIIAALERVRDLPATLATAVAGLAIVGGLAGYLAVPLFTRRFAARSLLLTGGGLLVLGVGALVSLASGSLDHPGPEGSSVLLVAVAALSFGLVGAVFYATLQATYLGLRPGEAGTTQAVVSTIGLLGIAFPAAVGVVSDALGLAAGLGLYAAVPVLLVIALLVEAGAASAPPSSLPGERPA